MARTVKELTGMSWLLSDINSLHLNSKNTIKHVKEVLEAIDTQPLYDNLEVHTLIMDYIEASKNLDEVYSSLYKILNEEWRRQIRDRNNNTIGGE